MVFVVITKTPEAAERLLKNVAPERRLTWKPDTHLVDVPGDTAGTAAQRLVGEEEPEDALFFLPTDLSGWGRAELHEFLTRTSGEREHDGEGKTT